MVVHDDTQRHRPDRTLPLAGHNDLLFERGCPT
jgi:hypothetical protein